MKRNVPISLMLLGLAASAALAQPATVTVTTDLSGSSARLILTHSKSAVYAIQQSEGRINVLYAEPVLIDPVEQRLGDPLLKRFEMRGDRSLVLFTGKGYRNYDSFELRNPFRLVIDLQGVRQQVRPSWEVPKRRKPWQKIVVIDPGHGGIETGAVGPTGLREKDVTLDLALRLRKVLQRDSAIIVVLTRDEDRLVGLDERTAIANHNRADLFLSIHLNSSPRVAARGAETYYLSTEATDDEARTLVALENENFGVDEQLVQSEDGDARELELVLWDLAQNQYLLESSLLGQRMQARLNELTGVRDRGVRQAPFRVLMGATMPALLVEVGFISNPEEELGIKSLLYRKRVVLAMSSAVRDFLKDLDQFAPPGGPGAGSHQP